MLQWGSLQGLLNRIFKEISSFPKVSSVELLTLSIYQFWIIIYYTNSYFQSIFILSTNDTFL